MRLVINKSGRLGNVETGGAVQTQGRYKTKIVPLRAELFLFFWRELRREVAPEAPAGSARRAVFAAGPWPRALAEQRS